MVSTNTLVASVSPVEPRRSPIETPSAAAVPDVTIVVGIFRSMKEALRR